MSLINQMLNDLEKRQATNPETNPLAGRMNLTAPATRAMPSGPVMVLILVGAGIFGAFVWSQFQSRGNNPASMPAAQPNAASVTMPATTNQATSEQGSASATVPTIPAAPVERSPQVAATVATPVEKAKESGKDAVKPALASAPPVAVASPPAIVANEPPVAPSSGPSTVPAPTKAAEVPADKVIASAAKPVDVVTPKVAPPAPVTGKSFAQLAVAAGAMKSVTPDQKSGNLYKQAVGMLQQFRSQEAIELLRESLRSNTGNHDARILLAAVLADGARLGEAIETLEQGLKLSPEFVPYYRVMARTQATAGNRTGALATLQKGSAAAGNDAEYHALYAALLQQQGSHDEAVKHYLVSLRSDPMNGPWLVGVAISLQATHRNSDAMEAYKRAIDSGELAPDVAKFASEQLSSLRQ